MNSSAEPNTTSVIGTEQERPHTQNDELDPASCSDADAIAVQGEDEASRLKALATDVRDQDDLERNVERQVWLIGRAQVARLSRLKGSRQINCSLSRLMNVIKNALIRPSPTKSMSWIGASTSKLSYEVIDWC